MLFTASIRKCSGVAACSPGSVDVMNKIKDTWEETEKHYYALVEGAPSEAGRYRQRVGSLKISHKKCILHLKGTKPSLR